MPINTHTIHGEDGDLQFLADFIQDMANVFDFIVSNTEGLVRYFFSFWQGSQHAAQPKTVVIDLTAEEDTAPLSLSASTTPSPGARLVQYSNAINRQDKMLLLLQRLKKCFLGIEASADRLMQPFLPNECSTTSAWLNDSCIEDAIRPIMQDDSNIGYIHSQYSKPQKRKSFLEELSENGPKKKMHARFQQANVLLCPVNLLGNHWGLWVLDKRNPHQHEVFCLDGFNSNPFDSKVEPLDYAKDQLSYYENFIKPIAQRYGFDCSKAFHYMVPHQVNSADCGPAVDYWAEKVVKGTLAQSHEALKGNAPYESHRLEMAQRIIQAHAKEKVRQNAPKVSLR